MTPDQGNLYRTAVENMRREVAAAASATVVVSKTRGTGRSTRRSGAAGDDGGASGTSSAAGSRGATPPLSGAGGSSVDLLVSRLGSQRVNNIFTHLRKVAQHPLLVRNRYNDEQVGWAGDGGRRGQCGRAGAVHSCAYPLVHWPCGLGWQRRRKLSQHCLTPPVIAWVQAPKNAAPYTPHPCPAAVLAQVQQIAEIASTHRLFGGNCSLERVFKELSGYSDHQLHVFSSSWPAYLGQVRPGWGGGVPRRGREEGWGRGARRRGGEEGWGRGVPRRGGEEGLTGFKWLQGWTGGKGAW